MTCQNCGQKIPATGHNRPKKFCTDKCRKEFHNKKRSTITTCLNCGKETTTKYCCKECGIEYRNKKRKLGVEYLQKTNQEDTIILTDEERDKFIEGIQKYEEYYINQNMIGDSYDKE